MHTNQPTGFCPAAWHGRDEKRSVAAVWAVGTRFCGVYVVLVAMLLLAGCATPAGEVFPPLGNARRWPPAPEPARIIYVGQLTTNEDLRPSKSPFEGLGEALFGKKPAQSMLTPYAVCTDGGDRVFVADSGAQIVHMFDLKTRQYARWKPGPKHGNFSQPVGIAYDPAGRVIVSDSVAARLFVFSPKGEDLGELGVGDFIRPCGVAIEPGTRRIFVADAKFQGIVILSPEGKLVRTLGKAGVGLGEFNAPTNLAFDSQGRLYVSDTLNCRVQVFDRDLKPLRQIGSRGDNLGTFASPKGVGVDLEGHIYVVDAKFETVQIFDAEGELLLNFGEEGHEMGQFWLPAGICVDNRNRIWVADTYNRRLAVLEYLPEKQP